MALTVNAKSYTANSFKSDRIDYSGPNQTVSVKDGISLARTTPKSSATFSGVGRQQAKLTRTLTLTGALTPTGDAIFNVETSVPVGAASADIDTMCADMGAWIATSAFKDLLKKQLINQ